MSQVVGLDVEPDETIEPVGFAQPANKDVACGPRWVSRGIRLQR